jgi:YbbR domain-containing protein
VKYLRFFTLIRRFFSNPKRRKEFIAFFIAFCISTALWFLIILDKSYTTTYPFTFSVKEHPGNRVLKEPLPANSVLIINCKGWDLLKLMFSHDSIFLEIPVDNFRSSKKLIVTNQYKDNFKNSLPEAVRIIRIIPDTLRLEFDKLLKKKVKVNPDINVTYKKQYGQSGGIGIEPSYVTISGPETYVRDIETVNTEQINGKNISKSIVKPVKLKSFANTNIEFAVSSVQINLPVEKLTEGKFMLPVKLFNTGKQKITLIPDKVEVSFQAPINIFNKVKPESFLVFADQKTNLNTASGKFKVRLEVNAKYIYYTKVYPEYVDYIIEK